MDNIIQTKDIPALRSCFDQDAHIVSLSSGAEYQTVSLSQFISHHARIFQKYERIKEIFQNRHIEIYQEHMATVTVDYTYHMDAITQHGKDYFICIKDLHGQWRIVFLSYMMSEKNLPGQRRDML